MRPSLFRRFLLFFGVVLLAGAPLYSRDWYEPLEVVNPLLLRTYEKPLLLPGGFAETMYANQAFSDGTYDSFQINARTGHTIIGAPRFALSATYGAFLMNGPVIEGGTPGSRLQWLMNAVQFEYGFHFAWDLGPLYLLWEYSRTSQHPIRDNFSEVSSDLVKVGAAAPRIDIGPVQFYGFIRVGYSEIFDFWESRLEDPRTMWLAQPSLRVFWPGVELLELAKLGLFLETDAELAIARSARFHERGELVGNGAIKAGVRIYGTRKQEPGLSSGSLDLYLDYFGSDNSEIRDDEKTPVQLLGYAIRFRLFY
ncbi:MAG: hypothetical protein ACLFQZ_06400 [Spirochaetaceae bacterium]